MKLSVITMLMISAGSLTVGSVASASDAQEMAVYYDQQGDLKLPYSHGFCLVDKIRAAIGNGVGDIDIVIENCDPNQNSRAYRQSGGGIDFRDAYRIVLSARQVECVVAHADIISWVEDDPLMGGTQYTLALDQCIDLMP